MKLTIYFDIAAVMICVALLISIFIRKLTKGRNNALFIALVSYILMSGVFDIFDKLFGPVFTCNRYTIVYQAITNNLYYYFHNFCTPLYIMYLMSMLGIWHKVRDTLTYKILLYWPFNIVLVFLGINLFYPCIFGFTPQGIYYRGNMLWVLYIIALYYMVFGLFILFKFRKMLSKMKIFVLSLFIPACAFAVLLQLINIDLRIEIAVMAIMSVIVSLSLQRPEESLDSIVNALSYNSFVTDMTKYFSTGRPMGVLLVKITNHEELRKNLGIENYSRVTRIVSERLTKLSVVMNLDADVYYLDRGALSVVVDENKYDYLCDVGRLIHAYMEEPLKLNTLEVKLDTLEVALRLPRDFDDVEKFLDFSQTFRRTLPNLNKLLLLEDYSETQDFKIKANVDSIISKAITEHNFRLYYQPIYAVATGKFESAEALIRLIDNEYGFVSPAIFIPPAERSGAIHKIGDFVINEVCRFVSDENVEKYGIHYIELNLSVAQCIDPNLVGTIQNALTTYNVSCEKINLEITETAVDYDPEMTDDNINKLSAMGLSFSLDDYGTGYSNIARVASLPLDIVKIDKSMVDEIDNPTMWVVIVNTVEMLKKLNKKILVEGVEDQHTLDKFIELGVDYIQGFYFSKPLPEMAYLKFVQEHNMD